MKKRKATKPFKWVHGNPMMPDYGKRRASPPKRKPKPDLAERIVADLKKCSWPIYDYQTFYGTPRHLTLTGAIRIVRRHAGGKP